MMTQGFKALKTKLSNFRPY